MRHDPASAAVVIMLRALNADFGITGQWFR